MAGVVIEGKVKKKGDAAAGADFDEDDLAMEDNRTSFLLSEFKPDLYQLAVSIVLSNLSIKFNQANNPLLLDRSIILKKAYVLTRFFPQLGELAPNSITAIELKYVCELPIENNAVKLSIPNTIAPQYSKPPNDCDEKKAADEVRLFPRPYIMSYLLPLLGFGTSGASFCDVWNTRDFYCYLYCAQVLFCSIYRRDAID